MRFYRNDKPELIIPVPLHEKRLKERGYNQSLEIARPIARQLKIPLAISVCDRIKHTPPQSSLSKYERQQNLHGAFSIHRTIPVKHVVIFDDVVTTGSTVVELGKILHQAGIERVDVWCVARTV
jgi:ComF family protein